MNGSDKELVGEILAGKMRNAWQAEDRPNQPDTRPAKFRQGEWNARSQKYRDNFDRIFKNASDMAHETNPILHENVRLFLCVQCGHDDVATVNGECRECRSTKIETIHLET